MHARRQSQRGLRFFLELKMPRGQRRAQTKRAARQQHVLHGGIDRGASGTVRVRTVFHAGDDPDRGFVIMFRQVFDRAVLALVFDTGDARRRRAGGVTRADNLIERLFVPGLHGFLDRRVLDDHEAPFLRVAAIGGAKPGFQHFFDQRVWHGVRLQPPHGAGGAHDLEHVVDVSHGFILPCQRRAAAAPPEPERPPSTTMCVPVTLPERPEQRYSTTPATSSGSV